MTTAHKTPMQIYEYRNRPNLKERRKIMPQSLWHKRETGRFRIGGVGYAYFAPTGDGMNARPYPRDSRPRPTAGSFFSMRRLFGGAGLHLPPGGRAFVSAPNPEFAG